MSAFAGTKGGNFLAPFGQQPADEQNRRSKRPSADLNPPNEPPKGVHIYGPLARMLGPSKHHHFLREIYCLGVEDTMNAKNLKKALATTTVLGIVAGTTLLVAGPAMAAAGDATAVGVGIGIDAGALSTLAASVNSELGRVAVSTGDPDAESELAGADADISGSILASSDASAVRTSASSTASGATASAEVDDLSLTLFGIPDAIASNGTLSAQATCPVDDAPSADTDITGLTVFGAAVGVAQLGTTSTVQLTGPFAGLTLAVSVDQQEETDDTSALATALVATVGVTGSLVGGTPVDVAGTVTLASASCERPLEALEAISLTPDRGPTSGDQSVTITGTGFGPGTTVTFGGVAAESVTVAPDGQSLVAVTPPGVAGLTTAVVTSGGQSDSLPYTYVAPTVASLTPGEGAEDGGTTVTIVGTGLGDTTTVTFGDEDADIVDVSDDGTQVVVTTPAGIGTVPVTVGSSTGVEVAAGDFEYLAPAILGYTPTGGPEAGGTTVTIVGTHLEDTDTVTFGGANAAIVSVSDTEVVVVTPAGTGRVPVVIQFTDDRTATAPQLFRYIADEDRSVIGMDPHQGPVAGGQDVTITGTALDDVTTVTFGGQEADIIGISADGSQVIVRTPAGTAGFVGVELTFSDDTTRDAGDYLYVGAGSAMVDTITPSTGSTSGGTTVVITGDNLSGVTQVTFGGNPGTIVGTPTDTSITVRTPAGAAGTVDVVLYSAGGAALVDDGFTYVAPAAVVSGTGSNGKLASTGVDTPVLPLTVGGLMALLAGAALLLWRRKRTA